MRFAPLICLVAGLAVLIPACGGGGGGGGADNPDDGNDTPAPAPLAVATTVLPDATVNVLYQTSLSAQGGTAPYQWALNAGTPPPGIQLSGGVGELSGTPTATGTSVFTVEVTDSEGARASRELSIHVGDGTSSGSFGWTMLSPGGSAPAGRSSAAAIADVTNNRMIVALGSTGSSGVLGDSAALGLSSGAEAWGSLPTGPTARWGHSMVYDSSRGRALLYGGNLNGFQTGNDVWALDLTSGSEAWTQLAPGGVTAPNRIGQAAVYDSANDRMVVFGGGSGIIPNTAAMNDAWALDFSGGAAGSWSQLAPTGTAPSARIAMVAAYDANDNRMIVFGGDGSVGTGALNDVWALDLSTPGSESWTKLTPGGTAPSARRYAAGAYDTARDSLFVFGGENNNTDYGDVFELSLASGNEAWTGLSPSGSSPAARDSHVAVYDGSNNRVIFYGGFTLFPSTPFTDVWALDLP